MTFAHALRLCFRRSLFFLSILRVERPFCARSRRVLAVAVWLVIVTSPTAAQVNVPQLPPGWQRATGPVLVVGPLGSWDDRAVYAPRLTKRLDGTAYRDEQGRYFLYYTANSFATPNADATGLALSTDLLTWTRPFPERPVLARGAPGTPDQSDASAVTVLHDGTLFHVWYEGNGRTGSDLVTINYATSSNGFEWTKRGSVLTQGADGDAEDLYAPVVMKDGATWKMWYVGHDRAGRLGMMHATARAPEGPWTKASESYLFYPRDLFASDVWIDHGVYHLLYFESTARRREVKLATSVNGLQWTPRGAVFVGGPPGSWDSSRVTWPTLIAVDASWVLFYDGHNGRERIAIGLARGSSRYGLVRGGTGLPGPPIDFTVSVDRSRVLLSWSPPVSGDAAQRYVIEAGATYGGSELGRFERVGTSVSFDPVGDGDYFVRVRAVNASGTGDASGEANFAVGTCDEAPGAPRDLFAATRRLGAGAEVTLTWGAPAAGCQPTAYVVEAGSHPGSSDLRASSVLPIDSRDHGRSARHLLRAGSRTVANGFSRPLWNRDRDPRRLTSRTSVPIDFPHALRYASDGTLYFLGMHAV
jgi:hypothetical protein